MNAPLPKLTPDASRLPAGVRIEPIPAFRDNYIWAFIQGRDAFVVDPGDAAPVRRALEQAGLSLSAIVVTHHHPDHVGGVDELRSAYGVTVFGPKGSPYAGIDRALVEGDPVDLLGHEFTVIAVPGHTLDHIAYWSAALGVLFCGDTLFACGCGRLFEGTPAQMANSLAKLAALPGDALVYCTHEYTLSNLRFARAVEPASSALERREAACQELRAGGIPTLPSTIALERATNPFLRCDTAGVRAAVRERIAPEADDVAVFAAIRAWKDSF
jgi:hydroxyacylglutathione hydrolase